MIFFTNNKTGKLYTRVGPALDVTNGSGNRRMVIYKDGNGYQYVREEGEFHAKFSPYEG